mmetsp:Transcript_13546/g.56920  ORF Transcript_13546/g.56920 Transcript_13546/m.56920 type:complete len:216 (-) Transcript_13546:1760-2407(-)
MVFLFSRRSSSRGSSSDPDPPPSLAASIRFTRATRSVSSVTSTASSIAALAKPPASRAFDFSARTSAAQNASPPPPTRVGLTSTRVSNPLCAADAAISSRALASGSSASALKPREAAAREKYPRPAPTSTNAAVSPRAAAAAVPVERNVSSDPTSASALVGLRAASASRPGWSRPHLVKEAPPRSTADPANESGLLPSKYVNASNGGSNDAHETG